MGEKRNPKVFRIEIDENRKISVERSNAGACYSRPLRFVGRVRRRGRRRVLKAGKRRVRINSADSFCGVPDDKLDDMLRGAVELRIQASKNAGKPVAGYDRKMRRAYIDYPDGKRIYE